MTSPNEKQRVIPARVYDAIKAQAEIHGGVGAGEMYRSGRPCCGIGLAHAGGAFPEVPVAPLLDIELLYDIACDVDCAGFTWRESDAAVDRLSLRGNGPRVDGRAPFDAWIRELNAVRGDDQ